MIFKILIVFLGLLLITQTLHLEAHTATSSATCISPGLFNSSTGQCDCKNGSIANTTSKTCVCPKEKPWFKNHECLPCPFPHVFDPSSDTCYSCPDEYAYNLTDKKCHRIICKEGKVYVSAKRACECPKSSPHEYSKGCHKCP